MRARSRLSVAALALGAVLTGCAGTEPTSAPAPTTVAADPTAVPTTTVAHTTTTTSATAPAPTTTTTRAPTTTAQPTRTTRPTTAAPAPAGAVRGAVVVLDPGHDGGNAAHPAQVNAPVPDGRGGTKACNTTGTSTDAGYPEHAYTFAVATQAAALLRAKGVRVQLTRPDDGGVGPCVDQRARIGNTAAAAVVVSIHGDGAAPSGHGFHVAYASPPLNAAQSGPSPQLARTVRDAFVADGFTPSTYLGADGLDPRSDLAGLNLSTRPTVLVETGNMRNAADAARMSSPAGRAQAARAVADGVLAWLAAR